MWLHGRESSYMPDVARKRAFRIGRSRTGLGLFATAPIKKRVRASILPDYIWLMCGRRLIDKTVQ